MLLLLSIYVPVTPPGLLEASGQCPPYKCTLNIRDAASKPALQRTPGGRQFPCRINCERTSHI